MSTVFLTAFNIVTQCGLQGLSQFTDIVRFFNLPKPLLPFSTRSMNKKRITIDCFVLCVNLFMKSRSKQYFIQICSVPAISILLISICLMCNLNWMCMLVNINYVSCFKANNEATGLS